jgi:hypothetical protein
VSEYRIPEEDTITAHERRTEEDAQRYEGHEDPDEASERAGLRPESGEKPEGAPLKRDGQATEAD